jgi:hypothetical protein
MKTRGALRYKTIPEELTPFLILFPLSIPIIHCR